MNKIILWIGALLLSSSAYAFWGNGISQDSSWEDILAEDGITIADPIPSFAMTFGYGVFNACQTESSINTIEPVSQCAEWKHREGNPERGDESYCVRYHKVNLSLSRSYTKRVCRVYEEVNPEVGQGRCLEYGEVTVERPVDMDIAVMREGNPKTGDAGRRHLFNKSFSLPACQ